MNNWKLRNGIIGHTPTLRSGGLAGKVKSILETRDSSRLDKEYYYSSQIGYHPSPTTRNSDFPDSLHSWVEKGTASMKCFAKEHNSLTQPRLDSTLTVRTLGCAEAYQPCTMKSQRVYHLSRSINQGPILLIPFFSLSQWRTVFFNNSPPASQEVCLFSHQIWGHYTLKI